jgi:hypothetical protein
MSNPTKTWVLIGAAVLAALGAEMVTVLVWRVPMSHVLADAPSIVVFVVGLIVGGLASHFWWAAKSRWREQDECIARHGDPVRLREGRMADVWSYIDLLWLIHGAKGPKLRERM